MWSCQLVTSDLNCSQDCSCPCNIVVVFEMYSLIGSLVVMCDCEADALTGTSTHASRLKYRRLSAKRACAQFKNISRVFWSHVHSSHVLRPLSATRSVILNVSTCSIVCCHLVDPTNGPTGDPGMVRLP